MWTIEQKKNSTFQSVHNVCVRALECRSRDEIQQKGKKHRLTLKSVRACVYVFAAVAVVVVVVVVIINIVVIVVVAAVLFRVDVWLWPELE